MSKSNWVGIYLLGGVIYELFMERNFDIFSITFWLRVFVWIPLIAVHWAVSALFIVTGLVCAFVLLYHYMPNFRTMVDRRRGTRA